SEVQVPGRRVLDTALPCPFRDCERREPGGHAETLLGTSVTDVDSPVIGSNFDATARGHTVGHQHWALVVALERGAERADVALHSGGGFRVYRGHDRRIRMRRENPLNVDRLAPLVLNGDDLAAVATRDIGHPLSEQSVDRDDHDITRMYEVRERGFHPDRSGAGQREGAAVVGLPDGP